MAAAKSASWSKSSGNKWLRRLLSLAVLLLTALLTYWGWQIHSFSKLPMKPIKADYIVVLGAKTQGTTPTPAFRERILYGLQLYRQGYAPTLLFTGGPGNPPQSLVAKDFALNSGIPSSAILVETQSQTTFQNLQQTKVLLQNPELETILIVSDGLHLKRAMLMAEDLGLKAHPAPVPNTVYRSGFGTGKFFLREIFAYAKYQLLRLFQ